MKFRKILGRMSAMCEPAWYIFKRSMQLALVLLVCGLLLTVGEPGAAGSYAQLRTSEAIYEVTEAVLLLGALLPVLVEDRQHRR